MFYDNVAVLYEFMPSRFDRHTPSFFPSTVFSSFKGYTTLAEYSVSLPSLRALFPSFLLLPRQPLSLSSAPSRLESTLLPVERLSGRKVNSMVFGKGRSERINPVSRFYDFLKKKSQEVYTVFLPPPSLAHVGHSVQILDFLRFYRFFLSLPPFRKFRYRLFYPIVF